MIKNTSLLSGNDATDMPGERDVQFRLLVTTRNTKCSLAHHFEDVGHQLCDLVESRILYPGAATCLAEAARRHVTRYHALGTTRRDQFILDAVRTRWAYATAGFSRPLNQYHGIERPVTRYNKECSTDCKLLWPNQSFCNGMHPCALAYTTDPQTLYLASAHIIPYSQRFGAPCNCCAALLL